MRLTYLAYTFSLTMLYFSLMLCVPVIVALCFQEYNAILPFIIAAVCAIFTSFVIRKTVKNTEKIA